MESFTASYILHFISPDGTYYAMLPMPKSTLTRIRFMVNVGAINEDKYEVKGVAHYLEHMKKKDSKFHTLEEFMMSIILNQMLVLIIHIHIITHLVLEILINV